MSGHYHFAVADAGLPTAVAVVACFRPEAIAATLRLRRRCHYSAVAEAMPLSTEFALHDHFDLLDTVVVLQNIVATPAATVINYSLSVSSVIKPFVVV